MPRGSAALACLLLLLSGGGGKAAADEAAPRAAFAGLSFPRLDTTTWEEQIEGDRIVYVVRNVPEPNRFRVTLHGLRRYHGARDSQDAMRRAFDVRLRGWMQSRPGMKITKDAEVSPIPAPKVDLMLLRSLQVGWEGGGGRLEAIGVFVGGRYFLLTAEFTETLPGLAARTAEMEALWEGLVPAPRLDHAPGAVAATRYDLDTDHLREFRAARLRRTLAADADPVQLEVAVEAAIRKTLAESPSMVLKQDGTFDLAENVVPTPTDGSKPTQVSRGTWTLEGERLRFSLTHHGDQAVPQPMTFDTLLQGGAFLLDPERGVRLGSVQGFREADPAAPGTVPTAPVPGGPPASPPAPARDVAGSAALVGVWTLDEAAMRSRPSTDLDKAVADAQAMSPQLDVRADGLFELALTTPAKADGTVARRRSWTGPWELTDGRLRLTLATMDGAAQERPSLKSLEVDGSTLVLIPATNVRLRRQQPAAVADDPLGGIADDTPGPARPAPAVPTPATPPPVPTEPPAGPTWDLSKLAATGLTVLRNTFVTDSNEQVLVLEATQDQPSMATFPAVFLDADGIRIYESTGLASPSGAKKGERTKVTVPFPPSPVKERVRKVTLSRRD